MLVSVSCTVQFKLLIICTDECKVMYSLVQVHFSNHIMYILHEMDLGQAVQVCTLICTYDQLFELYCTAD